MPIVPKGLKIDFLHRQVLMSRNVRGNLLVDAAMGGLNYQIEHHLFPSRPRPHLKRVRPLVRDYCAGRGAPYTELGLFASYAVVVDYLNHVGLRARGPFDCPLAAPAPRLIRDRKVSTPMMPQPQPSASQIDAPGCSRLCGPTSSTRARVSSARPGTRSRRRGCVCRRGLRCSTRAHVCQRDSVEPSSTSVPATTRASCATACSYRSARSHRPPSSTRLRVSRLCQSVVVEFGLTGATITLMVDAGPQGVAAASDPEIRGVDAAQFDVAEGPSWDSFSTGKPVLAYDLSATDGRWPGFRR